MAADPESPTIDLSPGVGTGAAESPATAEVPAKARMLRIVQDQPDDSSYDEILRELAFDRMIQRGLADVGAGRTLGDLEIRRRLRMWHGGHRR